MLKFKFAFLITALALVNNAFGMEGEAAAQGNDQELGASGFEHLGAPSQGDSNDSQAQKAANVDDVDTDGEGLRPDNRVENDEENGQSSASNACFFTRTRTVLLAFGVSALLYLAYNFYNNKTEIPDQDIDKIAEQV